MACNNGTCYNVGCGNASYCQGCDNKCANENDKDGPTGGCDNC